MLWPSDTLGLRVTLTGIIFGVKFTVNATLPDSEVEAVSESDEAPFHRIGSAKPFPKFNETESAPLFFFTLSGSPSALTSIKLYCSPFVVVTILRPPEKLLEALSKNLAFCAISFSLDDAPPPKLCEVPSPVWTASICQSTGSVKA